MKKINLSVLLLISILVLGCSARSPNNYNPVETVSSYGKTGEVKDVRIGDSILHYSAETVTEIIEVKNNLSGHAGLFGTVSIPSGIYVKTGEDSKRIFFSTHTTKGREIRLSNLLVAELIYSKTDHDITVTVSNDPVTASFSNGFTYKKDARIKNNDDDFYLRNLAYAGADKNLVSFEYKEGKNKHRITHNMNNGNIFSYQGVQVEIISYTPTSLTCKILQGFDVFK